MPKAYDLDLKVVKVSHIKEIAKGVYVLSFKRFFDFKAGQVVSITTDLDLPARLYSIASGTQEDEVRILFNVVPEGALTNQMAGLKIGESFYVSEAFGQFYSKDEAAYWIAAGTGIAPFASMFYSGQRQDKIVIHGGRFLESFYFQKDFLTEFKDHYIRCCSQEVGEGVYEGRLTSYLREQTNFPKNYKYYLCGSSEMVVECRDILISKGVLYENIYAEIYF